MIAAKLICRDQQATYCCHSYARQTVFAFILNAIAIRVFKHFPNDFRAVKNFIRCDAHSCFSNIGQAYIARPRFAKGFVGVIAYPYTSPNNRANRNDNFITSGQINARP